MEKYSFDKWGWFSENTIMGRQTTVAPPQHGEKVVGQPYPNWSGLEWIMTPYIEPVFQPIPEPIIEYKHILTRYELKTRFTVLERCRIRRESKINEVIFDFMDLLESTLEPDLDDPNMILGLNALERYGLISEGRAQEILTKYPI
jgi:hypothetical protein